MKPKHSLGRQVRGEGNSNKTITFKSIQCHILHTEMDKLTCNQKKKLLFELHGNIQLLEGSLPVLKSCPLLAKQIKNPSSKL